MKTIRNDRLFYCPEPDDVKSRQPLSDERSETRKKRKKTEVNR